MTTLQPYLIQTDRDVLEVAVVAPTPAERVQVVYHPHGWQVALVRMDGPDILPQVHACYFDAEQRAAELAVQYDITLVLDDDPDGEMAEGLMMQVEYADERRDAETRWMN